MIDYAIFVQARLGSTRFPKKVLEKIANKRVLDHVLDSCKETGIKTFLLTPDSEKDFFTQNFDVEVFGGSELDVLSRFVECAQTHDVKNIVRITSDCPCLPATHIKAVIAEHQNYQDYFVSNVAYAENTYESLTDVPDGFDVEVFSFDLLQKSNKNAVAPLDREHVTSWMRKNCRVHLPKFQLFVKGKFSLDNKEDLLKLEQNFNLLKSLTTSLA